ncbi:hypothetical protein [Sorangium sp. So ce1389]|uniref:hypothetical protein n=1 Tax=Sorangium sp. So ce1389 TaxID=3133336 RepID=UPI003F61A902
MGQSRAASESRGSSSLLASAGTSANASRPRSSASASGSSAARDTRAIGLAPVRSRPSRTAASRAVLTRACPSSAPAAAASDVPPACSSRAAWSAQPSMTARSAPGSSRAIRMGAPARSPGVGDRPDGVEDVVDDAQHLDARSGGALAALGPFLFVVFVLRGERAPRLLEAEDRPHGARDEQAAVPRGQRHHDIAAGRDIDQKARRAGRRRVHVGDEPGRSIRAPPPHVEPRTRA